MYPKFVGKGWEQVAFLIYRKISNINCTKSENFSGCRLFLQLALAYPLKPDIQLRMKM